MKIQKTPRQFSLGTNIFPIEREEDFPVQDATTITLGDGLYEINGLIITSKTLVFPTNAIVRFLGSDAFAQGFIYTGTGTFVNGSDLISLTLQEIFISTPNGTLYDLVGPVTPTGSVFIVSYAAVDCSALGTISGMITVATDFVAYQDCGTGLIHDDTGLIIYDIMQFNGWKNQSTSMLTFQGTIDEIILIGVEMEPNTNETCFDIKSTATIGNGIIGVCPINLSLNGSVFAAGSEDETNIQWNYSGNTNIPPSISDAELQLKGNLTVTSFSPAVADNPTRVAGTWTDSVIRFITDSNGRATYIGLEDVNVHVDANPTAVLDSGANKDVTYYMSKGNDTLNTITAVSDQGGGVIRFTTGNPHGLTTGDRATMTNTTSYNGTTYTITVIDTTNFDVTETFVATETGNWQVIIERSSSNIQIPSTSKSQQAVLFVGVDLVTNDFVELFVENNDDGTGILIRDANFLIN